jgi:hypothetical protein
MRIQCSLLKKVKNYKVSAKHVKSVSTAVLSLGLLFAVVANGNLTLDAIAVAEDPTSFAE